MTCLIMTLEEMLKLALGTTTPDQLNMEILHSFLKIVIQKLQLQADFVEITGPAVSNLRQILCHSNHPAMDFKSCTEDYDDQKCYTSEKVSNMENEIARLSGIVEKMEVELKTHLEALEKCKLAPAAGPIKWKQPKRKVLADGMSESESDSSGNEAICTPCDEKHLVACNLLQNHMFLKKLMRRVTAPVIDRMFEFENLIRIINEKFQMFLNIAEDEYKKIPLIEECLRQMEFLNKKLDRQEAEFITTMEEIQDILDTKSDKNSIPPLKKYLQGRMDEIERQLSAIIRREECPKAAAVIMNNLQCLCCTTRVCQKDRVYPVPLLANVTHSEPAGAMAGRQPRLCIPRDRERACGGEHTVIRTAEKSLQKTNLIDEFGDKLKLTVGRDRVDYMKGTDGGMYRLAPDAPVPCKGQL